jgi:esterase/lipase superfamily enzyme
MRAVSALRLLRFLVCIPISKPFLSLTVALALGFPPPSAAASPVASASQSAALPDGVDETGPAGPSSTAGQADSADGAAHGEQGDEDVWVVSTRHLPETECIPRNLNLGVERLVDEGACGRWVRSDLQSLLDDPQQPLMIFIHGNRYDPASAKSQGLMLARRSAACRPDASSVRTVIFSWPSSQEGLLLKDSRAKYERSLTEGRYFAWLLGRMNPDRPVAIVAYSYGGLIAMEALDHLATAERSGRSSLEPWIDRHARVHLVLVAAAVRQDALAPRGPYRSVLQCIDRLTLLNNTRDKALGFFEYIDRSLRTEALGHEHMPARWLPPEIEFTQVDAAAAIGKNHRFPLYMDSPSLRQRLVSGALDGLTGK